MHMYIANEDHWSEARMGVNPFQVYNLREFTFRILLKAIKNK